jgi:hypothetical protein
MIKIINSSVEKVNQGTGPKFSTDHSFNEKTFQRFDEVKLKDLHVH